MSRKRGAVGCCVGMGTVARIGHIRLFQAKIGSGVLASDSDGTKTCCSPGAHLYGCGKQWVLISRNSERSTPALADRSSATCSDCRIRSSSNTRPMWSSSTKGTTTSPWARKPIGWKAMRRRSLPRSGRDCPMPFLVLIAPKPSPSRWHLRAEYIETHQRLKAMGSGRAGLLCQCLAPDAR